MKEIAVESSFISCLIVLYFVVEKRKKYKIKIKIRIYGFNQQPDIMHAVVYVDGAGNAAAVYP